MSAIGLHGRYYNELAERLAHAMDWRLRNLERDRAAKAEYADLSALAAEIQERIDTSELSLPILEKTAQDFRRIHDTSYSVEKYERIKRRLV